MSKSAEEIAQLLRKNLDNNGFTFQYSVMEKANSLKHEKLSRWVLHGAEFPVENKGNNSHVDFILHDEEHRAFLIGECKRADPATANWCFVKAPYTWRNNREKFIQIDKMVVKIYQNIDSSTSLSTTNAYTEIPIKDLGLEVKTGDKGNGQGRNDKSEINSALSQVLRNTSGFINHNRKLSIKTTNRKEIIYFHFIPVIFTTAKLWVSDVDISKGNIEDGKLLDETKVKSVNWLWFNYNRPNTLAPDSFSFQKSEFSPSPEHSLFTRSVAIVGVDGIKEFLSFNLGEFLFDYL